MDALLNLGGWGKAQGAIVTESGLEAYAKINPAKVKSFKLLAHGRERLLPVVVAPVKPDAASQALIEVLKKMGESAKGKERLQLLGLDAFVPTTDSQIKQLNQ